MTKRIGLTGTSDRHIQRIVQEGGRIRYDHEWWSHDNLKSHVGIVIIVHDYAFLGTIDVYECWWPRGTVRAGRHIKRIWQRGTLICEDVKPEVRQEREA